MLEHVLILPRTCLRVKLLCVDNPKWAISFCRSHTASIVFIESSLYVIGATNVIPLSIVTFYYVNNPHTILPLDLPAQAGDRAVAIYYSIFVIYQHYFDYIRHRMSDIIIRYDKRMVTFSVLY